MSSVLGLSLRSGGRSWAYAFLLYTYAFFGDSFPVCVLPYYLYVLPFCYVLFYRLLLFVLFLRLFDTFSLYRYVSIPFLFFFSPLFFIPPIIPPFPFFPSFPFLSPFGLFSGLFLGFSGVFSGAHWVSFGGSAAGSISPALALLVLGSALLASLCLSSAGPPVAGPGLDGLRLDRAIAFRACLFRARELGRSGTKRGAAPAFSGVAPSFVILFSLSSFFRFQ